MAVVVVVVVVVVGGGGGGGGPRGGANGWSRHCATSRKVAGSIPDGINGIFH